MVDGPLFDEADLNVTVSVALNGRPDNDDSTYIVQISTEDATAKGAELNADVLVSVVVTT